LKISTGLVIAMAVVKLKKGDSVFTDPNDVSNIWYDHFRNVFSPSTYSDQGRQDEISERVSTIRTLVKERIRDDEMVIKLSDVSEICTRLKNNKACGHDNISYEHIKYGGKLLIKHLCYLFNLSLQYAYIPNDWRKSIIILLYKGDNKPRTDGEKTFRKWSYHILLTSYGSVKTLSPFFNALQIEGFFLRLF
jgi:hypothetical protein